MPIITGGSFIPLDRSHLQPVSMIMRYAQPTSARIISYDQAIKTSLTFATQNAIPAIDLTGRPSWGQGRGQPSAATIMPPSEERQEQQAAPPWHVSAVQELLELLSTPFLQNPSPPGQQAPSTSVARPRRRRLPSFLSAGTEERYRRQYGE